MIDYQFDGLKWIDQSGVASKVLHGIAHGGEIDDAGDPGEVLQEDTAGGEGDFLVRLGFAVPVSERADFVFGDIAAVLGAEQVLEQNAERKWQVLCGDSGFVEGVEAIDFVFLAAKFQS